MSGTGFAAGLLSVLLLAGCAAELSAPSTGDAQATPPARGFLAGLLDPSERAGDDSRTRPRMPTPLARIGLAGGEVVVAGPEGYCIDPTTRQTSPERGFAVVASCSILSGGRVGGDVRPMMLTVTVGARGGALDLPSPRELALFAGSDLIAGSSEDGLVMANLAEGGTRSLAGGDPRHWRGVFVQGDHLVGLALYAPRGSPLVGPDGGARLADMRGIIASLSPGGAGGAQAAPQKQAQNGFLGRLFNRQDLP